MKGLDGVTPSIQILQETFTALRNRFLPNAGTPVTTNWALLSLEETVNRLDNRFLPLSIKDFSCIVCKCIQEKSRSCTLRMHVHLQECGLDSHESVGNSLILALVGVGCINAAQGVFDNLAKRKNSSWNALISGYVQCGQPGDALTLYQRMHKDASLHLSGHAFVALLKACTELKIVVVGCKLHIEIVEKGLLESNPFVASTLVDMYAKCGFLSEAQLVLDAIPVRDAVSWTALIAGYAESRCKVETLSCFRRMQLDGISPDARAFVCCLKACKDVRAITKGEKIFADIVRNGLEKELLVGNIVVDMYAKCGMLAEAHAVWDNHFNRSEVSWNVIMGAYEEAGCYEEILQCVEEMQNEELSPDNVAYVCCLRACASMGVRGKGQGMHADICRQGLETDKVVGSALVDMYAKCGSLSEAQDIFDKLQFQDTISWTALIAGHAYCGETEKACIIFDRMMASGIRPDSVTFLSLLAACSHSGLLDPGELCLDSMCKAYSITPRRKHYCCLIDLFGRAGFLYKAIALIQKMPFQPGSVMWHVILTVCQRWGNVKLGRLAFDHSIQLDENDVAAYICMSNIYVNAGMPDDADRIEAISFKRLAGQTPLSSWWKESTLLLFGE